MTDQPRVEPRRSALERFFGGHPVNVVSKLVLLSLVVGFLMSIFGLDVQQLVRGMVELVRETLRDGAGVFRSLGGYILTGAALVVPIWLLLRLTRRP
tara:strand:+ start:6579 stop:6869 length:291 start_codon:yes stop_codon:yes gene_type:complete